VHHHGDRDEDHHRIVLRHHGDHDHDHDLH
jgi:hypothetical protein